MTLKAGEVRVPTTREQLQTVAAWLERPQQTTLLGGIDEIRPVVATLLRQAARHERCSVTLPRDVARYCSGIVSNSHRGFHVPLAVSAFAKACWAATHKRVGAPGLTRAQLRCRLLADKGDLRELRRLRKRDQLEQRWTTWLSRLEDRGETLITSTEPPPS